MPRLIALDDHESQRRKLEELLSELSGKGYVLTGRIEGAPGGWAEVLAASRSGGLFDEKRFVVVEGAEQLGIFPTSLAGLLEAEADDVIVAVFSSNAKPDAKTDAKSRTKLDSKKIFSSLPSKEALKKITFIHPEASVPPWGRVKWLLALAGEKSCRLDRAAAALLAESLESQEELRSELEKLALYADGESITAETVRLLSFDEGAGALLRFLDGVCQNRPRDVVSALRHLESDPSPLKALTAIYNRLRPALYIACSPPQMEKRVLPAIGATREYALHMAKDALGHFGGERVKFFMQGLIRLSFLEKTSFAGGWPGFETELWRLMGGS